VTLEEEEFDKMKAMTVSVGNDDGHKKKSAPKKVDADFLPGNKAIKLGLARA
jgi:hypothetical protein